ncbi:hypothetical protein BsWGS_21906 [Bradybaena similaris]
MLEKVSKRYIKPVLLYGCESWNMNTQIRKILEMKEMWFLKQMTRIPWTAKVTNNKCFKMANESRISYATMRRKQTLFFGEMMRGEALNITTTGKINGRRGRGRPREMMLDALRWLGEILTELVQNTIDRSVEKHKSHHLAWHMMIILYSTTSLSLVVQLDSVEYTH